MPPAAPPPNFYDNIAAMKGGGAPAAPAGGPGGKDPDAEVLDAFKGIFKVLGKMEEKKPQLADKFGPIREMLRSAIVDVMKKDPKMLDEDSAEKAPTVTGNESPQEPGPTPPPPVDPTKVPA